MLVMRIEQALQHPRAKNRFPFVEHVSMKNVLYFLDKKRVLYFP